jgi:hypothetical protein
MLGILEAVTSDPYICSIFAFSKFFSTLNVGLYAYLQYLPKNCEFIKVILGLEGRLVTVIRVDTDPLVGSQTTDPGR